MTGEGTPEARWSAWTAPRSWPPLRLPESGRAVVASPHPDDETLGVGATMWMLTQLGWRVDVVAVTDGERSHAETIRRTSADLAALRRAEQRVALGRLGVGPDATHRLGLPDTHVADHVVAVADELVRLTGPGDWLLAPWEHDGHRDHDAVGRAARDAAARSGACLLAYPVWTWHWGAPDHPALRTWRPTRVDVSPVARRAKEDAIAVYRSQTTPPGPPPDDQVILTPPMLARHRRDWEVLLT